MGIIYVLAISILFQITAAILALRLIRVTGGRRAWVLIATGISFMAVRRSITLFHLLSGDVTHPPDLIAELVALTTSVLLVIGIALIGPLFLSIKRSEEEVRKINRSLKVLTMSNHAVIRATEESSLLKAICTIIVEIGGYRMAWVGFAGQDEKKAVRPIAHAGYEEGYLDTVNITWADTERGRGPTGKAIHTGNPCISKNILTDPEFIPWRDEATRRGYASSISLPLIANGQTIGALNIYAMETDAFDSEEANLLNELANDMAFGIMSLSARIERMRAEEALKKNEEELKKRVKELERFYDIAVGRELRMTELKEEIAELREKLRKYEKP